MKHIRGQYLFTVKSLANGKPEVKPEIKETIDKLLESLQDGQSVDVDINGDPIVEVKA